MVDMQAITTQFGTQVVHRDLDLSVRRGEILIIAGGSGSGKSVLLREMILLQQPSAGRVMLFGEDAAKLAPEQAQALRGRWGVMFQKGGLFSALTVLENVGLPLREAARDHSRSVAAGSAGNSGSDIELDDGLIDGIAQWKLALTGLPADAGQKRPGELSGGMLKRAALARALALDPELLFLDEPTSGLDPASAAGICDLILSTRALFEPTIVIVSHDLDMLWKVSDRVAVLGEGRVLAIDSMAELSRNPHPIVQSYFTDARTARQPAVKSDESAWKTN